MKKNDAILIGVIIIISLLGLFVFKILDKSDQVIAVIIQNDQIIERIDLHKVKEPRIISVTGNYHNMIKVENGRIRFEESDCPEQICVNTGWMTKFGDIAVCMPNKAIVTIEKQ